VTFDTSDWLAAGALAVAVTGIVYTVLASTPKENRARIAKVEIDVASLMVMQANTTKTLDRLVAVVDRVFEGRTGNGRGIR